MNNFEHDPCIVEQAELLRIFQRDGQQVMINMRPDIESSSCAHYYGMVERVEIKVPEPYVDIQVEKLVVEYFTQQHSDAAALFMALKEARQAVITDEALEDTVRNDLILMSTIESELQVDNQIQTIELGGIPQRITIGSIVMAFGVGRP